MINTLIQNFGGYSALWNIIILTICCWVLSSLINKRFLRGLVAIFLSLFITLQLISLYFTKSYIGYEVYVHFNLRDILGLMPMFLKHFALLFFFFGTSIYIFYTANKVFIFFSEKFDLSHFAFKFSRLILIFCLLIFLSWKGNALHETYGIVETFYINDDGFIEALEKEGMGSYVLPSEIKASKGKNIVIISLESFESGYLSEKYAHLTPGLNKLKEEWNYSNMEQNSGSGWTSGSLYTYLTGFPAFFGKEGNSIFQTSYYSSITSISHIFEKVGYDMTFLIDDANFSGTKDMLYTFNIRNIIDENVFGFEPKDKDLFDRAKEEILKKKRGDRPYVLFMSTMGTHFPDGIYDKRMEAYVSPQNKSSLEFMVSAVDYMVEDFIQFLDNEDLLENTVVYIFPDHLKMGDVSIFNGTGERSLYLISNGKIDKENEGLNQIDLPKVILAGAGIKHNAKFLTDFISGDKNKFILNNTKAISRLNTSGLLRTYTRNFRRDKSRFIAHAGGMIDGLTYTNSLEALNNSYKNGFRLFELDIIKTSDGQFVAAHDWKHWSGLVGFEGELPVSHQEFMQHRICNSYTPMDMVMINSWFESHPDAILVTDKVNSPKEFSFVFAKKEQLVMELFSLEAVKEGVEMGIKAMPSQNVLDELGGGKGLNQLIKLGVGEVAVSYGYITHNREFLLALKENSIKTYIFNVNFDEGKDEEYFVKNESDFIYGMYADKWIFP